MRKGSSRTFEPIHSFSLESEKADRLFYFLWIVILAYSIFAYWGNSYDDVFLAYRYAKNLEAGYGFVFNVGEEVLSTPAPLFVLMLTAIHKVLPVVTIPQVGSLISGFGLATSGLMLYKLGQLSGQRLIGAIAAALLVTDPFMLLTMGGETPLYIAFILTAIYCYLTGKFTLSGVVLGLALMNRTEAIVPIGILLLTHFIQHKRIPYRMGFAALITLMPWLIYATLTFGSPLTSSFAAKVSQVSAGLPRYPFGMVRWVIRVIFQNYPLLLSGLPAAILGALLLFRKQGKIWRIPAVWTVGQSLLYIFLPIPFYHWYAAQYGVLLSILIALGTVYGSVYLITLLPDRFRPSGKFNPALLAGFVILLGMAFLSHIDIVRDYIRAWPHNAANRIYRDTGLWFKENSPENSSIAYLEIGAIGFYSDRFIIDTLSLVTPILKDKVAEMDWIWAYQYFKPDYIIYNGKLSPWNAGIFSTDWFSRNYQEVDRILDPVYPFPLVIYEKVGDDIPAPLEMVIAQNHYEEAGQVLTVNTPVEQTFISTADTIEAIELMFMRPGDVDGPPISVKLTDEEGHVLATWEIPRSAIFPATWHRLQFAPVTEALGKRFHILLESLETDRDRAFMARYYPSETVYPDGVLRIGGRLVEGDLSFRVFSGNTKE